MAARARYFLLIVIGLFMAGCHGCGTSCKDDDTCQIPPLPKPKATELVDLAKIDIGSKQYSKALTKCRAAVELDPEHVEANYCVVVGNVGAMVQSLSSIISLVANLNLAPSVGPSAIDGKNLLGSFISEIEDQMAEIDHHAYFLLGTVDPQFSLDKFPLALDPEDLLSLLDVQMESNTGDELVIDLKGTWDSTQLHIMAGGMNAVQGFLDYLFAHNLTIDNYNNLSFDSSEGIADIFFQNPKIGKLDTDVESLARMAGSENAGKGVRLDFLSALSYLVGRDTALDHVAPANEGLRAAIKLSASSADAGRVIVWTDADANGIPEKISVPAIGALGVKIIVEGEEPIELVSEIENTLSVEFWEDLIQAGKDIRDNIEDGGATPYAVQPIVTSVFEEMAMSDELVTTLAELLAGSDASAAEILAEEQSIIDFLETEVPDLIYLNPGEFLAAPAGIRNLLPYYFEYTLFEGTVDEVTRVDLAYEVEIYGNGTTNALEKLGGIEDESALDYAHFDYSEVDVLYSFTHFPDVTVASLAVAPDGISATTSFRSAPYIRLQDSSFGGLLYLNLGAIGAGSAAVTKPDAFAFNKGLAGLLRHYETIGD